WPCSSPRRRRPTSPASRSRSMGAGHSAWRTEKRNLPAARACPMATQAPGSARGSAVSHQTARDAHHVFALVAAHLELELRRHAQLASRTGHAARTVRRAARDLAHGGEILERVGQPHDDHAVVQERAVKRVDRRLLAAVLARGTAEHTADLAYQC